MNKGAFRFDRWFKDQLQHHEVRVPAHVWEGVSEELLLQQKRRRNRRFFWVFVPTLSVCLFGLGWWLGSTTSQTSVPSLEVAERQRETHSPSPEISTGHVSQPLRPKTIVPSPLKPNITTAPSQSMSVLGKKTSLLPGLNREDEPVTPINIQIEPLNFYRPFPAFFLNENEQASAWAIFENVFPEQETLAQNKIKTQWHLGLETGLLGQLAGVEQTGGPYLPAFGGGQGWTETNPIQWQLGLQIRGQRTFKNSPWGWQWSTGIQYQTIEVRTSREHIATHPFNLLPANTLQTHIFTQWGMLRGLWIEPNLNSIESDGPALSTDVVLGETTQSLEQTMGWIQFPIHVGLTWKNKNQRLGLWGQVGGSAGVQTRNEVWATGATSRAEVGQTAGLNPFRLDLEWQVGASFQPRHWPIQIRLGLISRYAATNLSHAPFTRINPVQMGGVLGVSWQFK